MSTLEQADRLILDHIGPIIRPAFWTSDSSPEIGIRSTLLGRLMAQQGAKPPTAAIISRPPLLKIFGIQTGLLVLASATVLLVDAVLAKSILIGGLISVLPNAYFARMAFRHRGARAARAVSLSFKRGEAGKFVLTVCLFAVVFSSVPSVNAGALFAGFIGMMLVNLVFAWQIGNRRIAK